jgi:hypothetical protein
MTALMQWAETLTFPEQTWSPAQVVSAHRMHRNYRRTALFLSRTRPVKFTGNFMEDTEATAPSAVPTLPTPHDALTVAVTTDATQVMGDALMMRKRKETPTLMEEVQHARPQPAVAIEV